MDIAVFGGAFDPFHSQHKKIIKACKDELNVDKVIVVPSFSPPHKSSPLSKFEDRLAMVKAGVKGMDYVIIDTIERERNTSNPTSEVLPVLKEKYPSDSFYFVIGGDSIEHFHTWIKPELIAKSAILAVVKRQGYNDHLAAIERAKKDYNAKILLLNITGEEVSSSIIKATLELGLEPQNIDKEIYSIIKKRKMYNEFSAIIDKLKNSIPKDTFEHSVSTTLFAMKYITKLKLSYQKVFLACILHDCAKHIKMETPGVPLAVSHQYVGAEYAQSQYGITDSEIINAIKCHTSGKPNMSKLDKLVYVADMLEPSRDFDGVEELRQELDKDFEKGFYLCVKRSMQKLAKDKKPIYPLTNSCLKYYTNK
ncbi:MAG: nicotinate (nicotinamide) nucleotide adenylyltransferase [Clostridiales bacterium]|nr:nicotinate (nicotinamide) nucleotide adenylyltransferase [Clostridiales bacterium]